MSVPRVTRPSEKAEAPPRIGVAMAVIMTGVLMTAVDTTIVVLALPEIQRGLHVALSAVVWVIISFLLVITLLATQVGRLGDMFGRVRMYEMGFAVFVLGSLACGLAWNEASIITFRVVQGIGGAFIMANSGAVIADLYPRELRGRAYGFTSVGWTMGAVIGIVLGGLIVTYVSWRQRPPQPAVRADPAGVGRARLRPVRAGPGLPRQRGTRPGALGFRYGHPG